MAIIEVNHVTKEYQLGALTSLKQSALNGLARLRGQPVEHRAPFKALDDVDFKVEAGEVLGIIGHNGAGKSTLLKMLAKISVPTRGSVVVKGKVAPLIEVGAGLVPDLTGRENIYLNGIILGISRSEIKRKFDDIVAFAELEEFIDTPIKRYSSGMQVRLGFSIATTVDADILIVDEVLAVGDLAFQRKCFDRMEDLIKKQGKTVLIVSHNIRQIERLCSRAILLDKGAVFVDGNPQQVCNSFYEKSDEKIIAQSSAGNITAGIVPVVCTGELVLNKVNIIDEHGEPTARIRFGSDIQIHALFDVEQEIRGLAFGVGVHTPDMIFVANDDSSLHTERVEGYKKGLIRIEYRIQNFFLLPGVYALRIGVAQDNNDRPLYYAENLCHFTVFSDELPRARMVSQGFVGMGGTWHVDTTAF